jgi:hypothetical protein
MHKISLKYAHICICIQYLQNMSIFLGNMHTFIHMYMHDKNLIKTKLILLKHVEQLLLLIKHNVDTTQTL